MSKVMLPVADPYISVFPIFANPLSILQNEEGTKGWIFNHFIQLCANSESEMMNFYDFNYKLCPYFKIQRMSIDFLKKLDMEPLDFMLKCISNGYYIYLLVNMTEIHLYDPPADFAHDLFIYGFDEEERVFYVSDNFINGKYSRQVCPFDEVIHAMSHIQPAYKNRLGFKGAIEMIEFDRSERQKFSLERVRDSLLCYINGIPTSVWNNMEYRNITYGKQKWYFGLNCYEFIHQKVDELRDGNHMIQNFHLIYDHKAYLLKLVAYLIENDYITDEGVIPGLKIMKKKALTGRNLVLKYRIRKEEDIIIRLHNIYKEIESVEKEVLPQIVKAINDENDRVHKFVCYEARK